MPLFARFSRTRQQCAPSLLAVQVRHSLNAHEAFTTPVTAGGQPRRSTNRRLFVTQIHRYRLRFRAAAHHGRQRWRQTAAVACSAAVRGAGYLDGPFTLISGLGTPLPPLRTRPLASMSEAPRAWLRFALTSVFDLHVRLPSAGRQARRPGMPGSAPAPPVSWRSRQPATGSLAVTGPDLHRQAATSLRTRRSTIALRHGVTSRSTGRTKDQG
jgi:hypothetical protein